MFQLESVTFYTVGHVKNKHYLYYDCKCLNASPIILGASPYTKVRNKGTPAMAMLIERPLFTSNMFQLSSLDLI